MTDSDGPLRPPSPLDAVPDMRSTAKWTIAALGAVGAVMIGAIPLSTLGKLDGAADLAIASIGLVLGVGGVAWAIWHTSEALTPPVTTLSSLDSRELAPLRAYLERSPESFFGPFGASVDELVAQGGFHAQVAINLADAVALEKDPNRRQNLERTLADAQANASMARILQRQLLEFAHAWQVRAALRRARFHTMTAVGVTLFGVILVMIAAASPASTGGAQ
jgi:hypothetical protein